MMHRWPRWILAATAVMVIVSFLAIPRLQPDTSLSALFARNNPAARAMVRIFNHYRSVEELLVLVSVPGPQADPKQLEAFAANFEQAVARDPVAAGLSAGVLWRNDAQTEKFFEQVVAPSAFFYLDDSAFAAARQRLTRAEIFKTIQQDRAMLSTPGPAAQELSKLIRLDPLHLHEFIMNQLARLSPLKTYHHSDAFLSPDGRSILIRVRGRRPVSDLQFSQDFTQAISRVAKQINHDHLELDFTGAYAIAAVSQKAIRSDCISSSVGSIVFLQLLFLLAYRKPIRSFLLAMAPIAIGILVGFAAYSFARITFTPVAAAIGAILAGMGIDYSIQFLALYQRRRTNDVDSSQAALNTLRFLWPAILAAWATSLIGFAAIGSANVQALRDFSLLGSLGLTGAFLAALTVLPAALALFCKRKPLAVLRPWFAGDALLQLASRQRRLFLYVGSILFLAAVIILAMPGKRLVLDPDLAALNPQPNPALDAEKKIQNRMGASPQGMICYLYADSPDALLHLAHQAGDRLRAEQAVTGTFGLDSLLPDPQVANQRLGQIDPRMANRVIADLRDALAASGFKISAFSAYADFLRKLITNRSPPDIHVLEQYPSLAQTLLPVDRESGVQDAVTYVFSKDESASARGTDSIDEIRASLVNLHGVTLTGLGVLSHDAEANVARQLPRLIVIAMGMIALYLLVHFRNLTDLILSLLPTFFSLACVMAFSRIEGVRLNIINLVAFPLLIGIDVDYGVFLVSAVRRNKRAAMGHEQFLEELRPSFSAVTVCAAATVLGFASLLFTSIPAVHSLGMMVSVGIVACLGAIWMMVVPGMMGRVFSAYL